MISVVKRAVKYPLAYYQQYSNKKILQRIKAKKEERNRYQYNTSPEITFIVQFFNKRENIHEIFIALDSVKHSEIIVIDDGSVDGSYKEWIKLLTKPNHFLLRSNDLHEVITYDRALRMAKGTLVCLLQDDDIPIGSEWVREAVLLFQYYPNMVILGGRSGLEIKIPDMANEHESNRYTVTDNIGSVPGVAKFRIFEEPIYRCPSTGIPFMFCSTVNRSPMFVRVSEYLKMGGTDLSFAPFQCDDVEVCLRAWKNGYRVGLYQANFRRNVGTGGMRLFNTSIEPQQSIKNWKKIYQLYQGFIAGQVDVAVNLANETINP